jgi:hypothetical protein
VEELKKILNQLQSQALHLRRLPYELFKEIIVLLSDPITGFVLHELAEDN